MGNTCLLLEGIDEGGALVDAEEVGYVAGVPGGGVEVAALLASHVPRDGRRAARVHQARDHLHGRRRSCRGGRLRV